MSDTAYLMPEMELIAHRQNDDPTEMENVIQKNENNKENWFGDLSKDLFLNNENI